MLFESLNGPKELPKSIAERADEQLELREAVEIEKGIIYTSKSGLRAFLFYRDHGWSKQHRKTRDTVIKSIKVNNPRKRYALS